MGDDVCWRVTYPEVTQRHANSMKQTLIVTYKVARRIVITAVGVTILLIGVALIVLPGPAFVVIPAGLAVLSLEFAWARHWLKKMKDGVNSTLNYRNQRRSDTSHEKH
ncbi:MAG: PGPGW domain-containing protein [Candidatus Competibacteraceae bacterium]